MARQSGAEAIYEVADSFRERCLKAGTSLLWPAVPAWSRENIQRFRSAFIDNPDLSERSFYQKWRDQLVAEPQDVHRIAADLVVFYYLFPHDVKRQTKLERLSEVIGWKLSAEQPDLVLISRAFDTSIGSTGRVYMSRIPQQMTFFLAFAEGIHAGKANPNDATSCKILADDISKGIKTSQAGRNVLLHLLFPDKFERIASQAHKQTIVNAFAAHTGTTQDVDEALLKIRQALSKQYEDPNIDFYQPKIKEIWARGSTADAEMDESDKEEPANIRPACWVEKTIVRGRVDREEGEYAVGRALWCPKLSRGEADIYRAIRDLAAGDIVLHLTDNSAFTRISRVSAPYEEFNGVPNTEWGVGPSYLARLRDSIILDPPLSRETFFNSPYRERLISVIDQGARNLFYNREPNLNQGAYLTSAPPDLVRTLNDAYKESTGQSLVDVVPELDKIIGMADARKSWIFQGNPTLYDIRNAIRALPKQTWLVARFKDDIRTGDRVYLWESGPDGGIVGVAEVIEPPHMGTSPEEERPFAKSPDKFEGERLRTTLKILKNVEPPISRKDVLSHRELTGLTLLRQPQGTNFRVTTEEARVLEALVAGPEESRSQPLTSLNDLEEATNLSVEQLQEIESLLRSKGQIILEGPPGSGKTYVAELFARYLSGNALDESSADNLQTIQFHQSYGYEDFIQGIRPETNSSGQLSYRVRPGVFKAFCDQARKSTKPFVFVVDEINRGNISRIFGELLFLLEYRQRQIPLPYDHEPFSIPLNVYLIGTMNTTDRSLAQIDYALRRRFYFYRLLPVTEGRAPALEKVLLKLEVAPEARQQVLRLFLALNNRIQERLGVHFQVGHSHFMRPDIGNRQILGQVWNRSVLPLLEEYFYNSRDRESVLSEFRIEALLAE